MVNKNRGEVAIKFGNKQYVMRPTFHALSSLETELNRSIIDVLLQFSESKPKLLEIVAIIYYGVQAYSVEVLDREKIGELICEAGIVNIMPKIFEFLENGLGIAELSSAGVAFPSQVSCP